MGEELCIALRAYTRGWDIYAPNKMVAWHYYVRKYSSKVWSDSINKAKWGELEFQSQRVQRDILLATERGIYGIADYQKYLDYQHMIGMNFRDVYENDLKEKINLGLVSQEIEFDDDFNLIEITKSGFCRKDLHEGCLAIDICVCSCHEEGVKNGREW